MARRRWLAKLLVYMMLEVGALGGLPMRPDQIEELTQLIQKTRVVHVVRRTEDGDGPPPEIGVERKSGERRPARFGESSPDDGFLP